MSQPPPESPPPVADLPPRPRELRPYVLTRGRVDVPPDSLPLEALVETSIGMWAGLHTRYSPTHNSIMQALLAHLMSVAEVSARLALPIPVTRVLLRDLIDDGMVVLHVPSDSAVVLGSKNHVNTRQFLERVLDGIAAL